MFISKRSFPINPYPTDSGSSDHKLTRGMLEAGVVINLHYSVNVTVAGAAVRARAIPIKRVSLISDSGKTLQVWRAVDLLAVAQIFEQTPAAALLTPPPGFAIANYAGLVAQIPLLFIQPGQGRYNDATAFPTFALKNDPTLRIEWGSVTDLLTGAPVGAITFTAPVVGGETGCVITQLDYADLVIPDGLALARRLPVAVNRYIEQVQLAVANPALVFDLGIGANIRGLLITQEIAGEPVATIINKVSFIEDDSTPIIQNVPFDAIRADNAKHYGVTPPTGVAVVDFAEDGNIFAIYRATRHRKVSLVLDTAAVAGTIRVAVLTIETPIQYAA